MSSPSLPVPVPPSALSADAATQGLTTAEARLRLQQTGPNVLTIVARESLMRLAARQFRSLTVLVLAGAAGVSVVSGDYAEGVAIGAVVVLNAVIGFVLEWQARASMDALHALDVPQTRALRDGQPHQIPAAELVPRDVLLLEGGDVVPADADLLETHQLQVNESALTGESLPVGKQPGAAVPDAPLADQRQRVFKGTAVVDGNGRAVVVATGMSTELGRITHLVQTTEHPPTPLETKLNVLARQLILLTVALALAYVLVGWLQSRPFGQLLKTAVVLAVAAIPEGLSIVATLALAHGTLRLARRRVLVKHLPAVETLGSTSVIFTDKTGTLTQNQIQVHTLWLAEGQVALPATDTAAVGGPAPTAPAPPAGILTGLDVAHLRQLAALCNNATLDPADSTRTTGDPLEVALLQFARADFGAAAAAPQPAPPAAFPRLAEQAFSADTRLMGTLHQLPDGRCLVAVKGGAEAVMAACRTHWIAEGTPQPLLPADQAAWLAHADELAGRGRRTLAFASAELPSSPANANFVRELAWVGLVAFLDPPRMEVAPALAACRAAGIRVMMVTGDHPATARTVAIQVRLSDAEGAADVVAGPGLTTLLSESDTDTDATDRLRQTRVFARVSPAQKLELIARYQQQGEVVGMVGDGVNDPPALRRANIGIAMGQRGTQVAAETADLVLQDDAFSSIVAAIAQGRIILTNIRTFLLYLISCNLSEVLIVTGVGLLHPGVGLLPLQILFLNLLTDVFPALALAVGRGNACLMRHPPRPPQHPLLLAADWLRAARYAAALTLGGIGAFSYARWGLDLPSAVSCTVLFYALALAQLLHVFNFGTDRRAFWRSDVAHNPYVWGALGLCTVLLLGTYLLPALRQTLGIVPLPVVAAGAIAAGGLLPLLLIQATDWLLAKGLARSAKQLAALGLPATYLLLALAGQGCGDAPAQEKATATSALARGLLPPPVPVAPLIEALLDTTAAGSTRAADAALGLQAGADVRSLYDSTFAPVWSSAAADASADASASLNSDALAALTLLTRAPKHGLRPDAYGLPRILALRDSLTRPVSPASTARQLTQLDVRLSDAVLRFMRDVSRGRLRPYTLSARERVAKQAWQPAEILRVAL
ncbi:MAG: cation-transporting P-type ATPase, partial [Hymenobacteraceae bacterium]|nr:cation-transporting P-type ATPase [Hymenobacteraceae bacterium]